MGFPGQINGVQGVSRTWAALIALHDRVFSDARKDALKRLVVKAGIAGFAVHLLLVFLARTVPQPPPLLAAVGTNYLSAITTPFNFILFYEVLTLIAALPASTTRSIGNQFEIVSLVFIRDVFRDFSGATEPNWIAHNPQEVLPLVFDMVAGLTMYFLVTIFQHVAGRQVGMPPSVEYREGRKRFENQKKVVALGLTALLLLLAVYHLVRFVMEVCGAAQVRIQPGNVAMPQPAGFFYNDLFTVMIFTDVLLLILGLVISGRYEMVFRNAAFVVSIILIRFSLGEERPYGAAIALGSMVFGILTLLVFNYHSRLRVREMLDTKAGDH